MLSHLSAATVDASKVGGKAVGLGRLMQLGMPVPPGFVIETDEYERHIQSVSTSETPDPTHMRHSILQTTLTESTVRRIEELLIQFPSDAIFAVRSSATTEDLAHASFAGQQETILGVSSLPAMCEAVLACWASLWSERAVAYRRQHGISDNDIAMAVVVQQLIMADTSGIAFSRDPYDPQMASIDAVYGLGELAVSGQVTPDHITFHLNPPHNATYHVGSKHIRLDWSADHGMIQHEVPLVAQHAPCLTNDQVQELGEKLAILDQAFPTGCDCEWAFSAGNLWLLQARPITTSEVDARPLVHQSTAAVSHRRSRNPGRLSQALYADMQEHYPAPYPLDLYPIRKMQDSLLRVLREYGISTDPAEKLIRADNDGTIRLGYPRVRVTPLILRSLRAHVAPHEHWLQTKNQLRQTLETLSDPSPAKLSESELLKRIDEVLDWVDRIAEIRFRDHVGPAQVVAKKLEVLLKLGGRSDLGVFDLLQNLQYKSKQIELELHALTTCPPSESPARKRQFLTHNGARTMRTYLAFTSRSWRENPSTLDKALSVLSKTEERDFGPWRTQSTTSRIVHDLQLRYPRPIRSWALRSFETNLDEWRRSHLAREDSLYLIEEGYELSRRYLSELIGRLCHDGRLHNADSARFLYFAEIQALIDGSMSTKNAHEFIAQRTAHRPQATTAWWATAVASRGTSGPVLKGIPGSRGVYRGRARVLHDANDFDRLAPGEILVCQYTDPSWTPLFAIAGAVVAQFGAQLSHAAIVAREYGIPAVMAVPDALHKLHDGSEIQVDGTNGTVTIL